MVTVPFYYTVSVKVAHPEKQGTTSETVQLMEEGYSYSFNSIIEAVEYCSTHEKEFQPNQVLMIDITLQGQRLERMMPAQWKKLAVGLNPNLAENIYNTLKSEGAEIQDVSKLIIQTVLEGKQWRKK